MNDGRSTVERALQLARDGQCRSVEDIRRKLKSERHDRVEENLSGTAIRKQLKEAISVAAGGTVARRGAAEGGG